MDCDDIELLGIKETLSNHAHPGQVGFMLFELLNNSCYSLDEIKEISMAIVDHAEHMAMIPDRRKVT